MYNKQQFQQLWQSLRHPRVYIFIIIGTGIIFLTFLTTNNALEIAISGIASVFIGIGVNNFTSFETHLKDEQKIRIKVGHSLKVMAMANSKIENIQTALNAGNYQYVNDNFIELKQFMTLMKQLLIEEELLV